MHRDHDPLQEEIMSKGIKVHYPAEVLADAQQLHKVWVSRFPKSARGWSEVSNSMRIAFCEMAKEARRLPPLASVEQAPQ
jgi:hypothetical protein